MLKDFLNKNKRYILLGVFILLQTANMFAVHLFVNKRFISYGKVILAMIKLPNIKYNTSEYYHALNAVSLILSFIIGGLIVLAVTKMIEILAIEFKVIDKAIYAGIIPVIFWGIHLLGVLGLWIFNKNLYGWLCPLLAYTSGIGSWAVTLRKNKGVQMI